MKTSRTTSTLGGARRPGVIAAVLVAAGALTGPADAPVARAPLPGAARPAVQTRTIEYESHTGAVRQATVVLPAWYGPNNNPPLPVVISPHGRGATGRSNADFFADMPARARFVLISPDGVGRSLKRFSYGFAGQIDDLAEMPDFATRSLPWLRIDRSRIYALGSSMGGQETLLLVARHPRLLAGAAAMDSVTDLGRRYAQLPQLPCDARCLARWHKPTGVVLQETMAREVGGTPATKPAAYAARSALDRAAAIARSGVPLQIWWSTQDRIVFDQEHQSEALFRALRRLNPEAPVSAYVGRWRHSTEMRASALLPVALSRFGLLPAGIKRLPASVHHVPAPVWAETADV
jgi:pimeloyl-ACP methyl ester carboxylesterase